MQADQGHTQELPVGDLESKLHAYGWITASEMVLKAGWERVAEHREALIRWSLAQG